MCSHQDSLDASAGRDSLIWVGNLHPRPGTHFLLTFRSGVLVCTWAMEAQHACSLCPFLFANKSLRFPAALVLTLFPFVNILFLPSSNVKICDRISVPLNVVCWRMALCWISAQAGCCGRNPWSVGQTCFVLHQAQQALVRLSCRLLAPGWPSSVWLCPPPPASEWNCP